MEPFYLIFLPYFSPVAGIRNAHDEHLSLLCELVVFKRSLRIVFDSVYKGVSKPAGKQEPYT